jgi:NhaA family Na+:H+ antiporter
MPIQKIKSFALLFKDAADKGILLLIAAVLAIIFSNSKYGAFYDILLNGDFKIYFEEQLITFTIHHFINEFLMAIFFFLVGLEIKRELLEGHLSTTAQRILPASCAIGGVIFPALIYYFFNHTNEIAIRGWAIPTATDIAFALGVFAYFGKNLPMSLRIFLTALAIIDDLIAVIIIAFFYSDGINEAYIYLILLAGLLLYFFNKQDITHLIIYTIMGCVLWYLFREASIHTTVAGVMLAAFVPLKTEKKKKSPLLTFEKILHPSVAYVILPLFAFANSGIIIDHFNIDIFLHTVTLGIILGLVIGKQIGIFGTCWILVKTGFAQLPKGASFKQFYAVSIMCGIGFTMSLFIGELAFGGNNDYTAHVKIGVLGGSILSVILSALVLKFLKKKKA